LKPKPPAGTAGANPAETRRQLLEAAGAVFAEAGFRDATVHKGIESAERYVLAIHWDTLENHTVDFRGGPLFPQWRAIVGPFFVAPPSVEHFTLVVKSA